MTYDQKKWNDAKDYVFVGGDSFYESDGFTLGNVYHRVGPIKWYVWEEPDALFTNDDGIPLWQELKVFKIVE